MHSIMLNISIIRNSQTTKTKIMKTRLHQKFFTLIVLITLGSMQLSAQVVNNIETFTGGLNGWDVSFGTNGTVTHAATEGLTGDGALQLSRGTNNANFGIKPVTGIDASTKKAIRIRYKNGTNGAQLRIGGTNGDGVAIKNNTGDNLDISNFFTTESDEYITAYIDLSSYTLWTGTLTNFWLMVRQGVPDTNDFFFDEIEFLDVVPPTTYSEFIQNPSFDGPSGIAHLTGASTDATRAITSTESHDGTQSFKYNYTADATAQFWAFSSYEKVYPSIYTAGSIVQIKMWVKTNRTTPITMQTRLKLTNGGVENTIKPIANATTTNVAMGWEELTFDLVAPEDFDGVTLWFNIFYADETEGAVPENLNASDIVYVDQMSATITLGTLGLKKNTLQGVAVYPNPVNETLSINSPAGSNIQIYNVLGATIKTINKANKLQTVSVSGLKSGLYFIKVTNDGKVFQDKVIKR